MHFKVTVTSINNFPHFFNPRIYMSCPYGPPVRFKVTVSTTSRIYRLNVLFLLILSPSFFDGHKFRLFMPWFRRTLHIKTILSYFKVTVGAAFFRFSPNLISLRLCDARGDGG